MCNNIERKKLTRRTRLTEVSIIETNVARRITSSRKDTHLRMYNRALNLNADGSMIIGIRDNATCEMSR